MELESSIPPASPSFDNETELVRQLYASLTANNGFHVFLELLGGAIGASACTLSCLQRQPIAVRYLWHMGLPDGFVDEFIAKGMLERDVVFNSAVNKSLSGFYTASDALLELQQRGSADFWSESYEMSVRLGYHHAAWMVVHSADDSVIVLSMLRGQESSQYTRQELDKVERLVPHIRQVFQLYEQLNRSMLPATSLGAVLDAVPRPSLTLSDLSQVIHINRSARDLMAKEESLRIVDDRIVFRDVDFQTIFSRHLTEVLRSSLGLAPFHSESLYLKRRDLADLILCLTPIENIDQNRAAVLLTLVDPEQRQLPTVGRIGSYFSLTPAEAQLCADLVSGDSLKTIATRRHKSEATLRSYLKQIYQKTGYNRQGQLVSGILSALID